jgi:hypothetical protein
VTVALHNQQPDKVEPSNLLWADNPVTHHLLMDNLMLANREWANRVSHLKMVQGKTCRVLDRSTRMQARPQPDRQQAAFQRPRNELLRAARTNSEYLLQYDLAQQNLTDARPAQGLAS